VAEAGDWRADGVGGDGRLRHVVPAPLGMRVVLVGGGLFVLVVSSLELGRALWPPSLAGLFFALILLGAFSVGIPLIAAGLLGPSMRWTVSPRHIEIVLANPFRDWRVSIGPGGVASIAVEEAEGDGPSTFRVVLRTVEGRRYEMRSYGSRAAAETLRHQVERVFYG
jgi:hypothetical protein